MWCALRGPPLLGAIWDEEFLDCNTTSGSTSSMSSDGYWANLLRQLCSARNATFSVDSNAQPTIHSALASGFALSSKGHVRLALLAPSGVAVRAEGRSPEARAELNWLATWPSTERWGRLTGHELS